MPLGRLTDEPRTPIKGVLISLWEANMAQRRRPRIPKQGLRQVSRMWGVNLEAERLETLAPRIQQTASDLAKLNELDLGELEPAVRFQRKGD